MKILKYFTIAIAAIALANAKPVPSDAFGFNNMLFGAAGYAIGKSQNNSDLRYYKNFKDKYERCTSTLNRVLEGAEVDKENEKLLLDKDDILFIQNGCN